MINLRRDFGMVGKLFGVPRKIITQLCNFASFWQVESSILTLEIPAFPSEKNPVTLTLDEDNLEKAAHPTHNETNKSLTSGAQEDVPTDYLYDVDPETEENRWERGEEDDQDPPKPKGVEFFICCRSTDDNADGAIFFRKVRFDGLGHLVLVGNEDATCGAVVTYVDRSM